MNQSEQVDQLNTALATAQGQMQSAKFNRQNPHFRSKYADLASIWDAIREPLTKNALSVTQTTHLSDGAFTLTTVLRHASGQWVSSEYPLPTNAKPQEYGAALTYARRYSLSAIVGIAADEDDDAESIKEAPVKISERAKPVPPSKAAEALVGMVTMSHGGPGTETKVTATLSDGTTKEIATDKPFDWKAFGEQLIQLAQTGATRTPEQQAKFEEMAKAKPKSYANLVKALKAAQQETKEPSQPKPEDDPDAYRMWFIDQMSRFTMAAELHAFIKDQRPLWEPCFPPDIEDWETLVKERAEELG
jgi:hypothetical protein